MAGKVAAIAFLLAIVASPSAQAQCYYGTRGFHSLGTFSSPGYLRDQLGGCASPRQQQEDRQPVAQPTPASRQQGNAAGGR